MRSINVDWLRGRRVELAVPAAVAAGTLLFVFAALRSGPDRDAVVVPLPPGSYVALLIRDGETLVEVPFRVDTKAEGEEVLVHLAR